MTDAKQPHLSESYYGPSIPPSRRTYHRPGRGGGGGCNPFCCCCNCLVGCICNCLFQILCTIVIIVAILAVIIWFIFRPNKVNFHVTSASLSRFDYAAPNNTLRYDLSLNVTIRNSNKRLGIYYDAVEARAFYGGQRFATTQLSPFFQGTKNTTTLTPHFKGQQMVLLRTSDVDDYNEQRSSGMYDIDMKLYLRVRFKWAIFKGWHMKPTIECGLKKVPLGSNHSASGEFQTTKCGFDWLL